MGCTEILPSVVVFEVAFQFVSIKASPNEEVLCDSELPFVDLLFPNNRKIILSVFYRPPINDTKPLEDLQEVLENSRHQM